MSPPWHRSPRLLPAQEPEVDAVAELRNPRGEPPVKCYAALVAVTSGKSKQDTPPPTLLGWQAALPRWLGGG